MRQIKKTKKEKDEEEFFNLCARMGNISSIQVKRQWKIFLEVIIRELYTSGMVRLPYMGYLTLSHHGKKMEKIVDKDGVVSWFNIPERDTPIYKPDDDFINDINMIGVTKSYQNRMRMGELTPRDKERERRAKELLGTHYHVNKDKIAIDIAESTDEFNLLLQAKRQKYEDKLEEMLKESQNDTK